MEINPNILYTILVVLLVMNSSSTGLKEYEKEILVRMMEAGYIGRAYASIEKVASAIHWDELVDKYGIRKGFKSVLRSLKAKGLVTDHGKSLRVISLTKEGLRMVLAIKKEVAWKCGLDRRLPR